MNWTRRLAWVLVAIEVLWALYWFAGLIWVQVTTDSTFHGDEYRVAHVIMLLHAVSPIALASVMTEHHAYSVFMSVSFLFSVLSDLWSVLENAIHLSRTENAAAWNVEMILASWGIAASSLTLLWYLIMVIWLKGSPSPHVGSTGPSGPGGPGWAGGHRDKGSHRDLATPILRAEYNP
jgi:hypothetical protein